MTTMLALPGLDPDIPLRLVPKAAKQRGSGKIPEIARREAKRLGLTPKFCRTYLTEYITFDLGPAERAGLRRFGKYAKERS